MILTDKQILDEIESGSIVKKPMESMMWKNFI